MTSSPFTRNPRHARLALLILVFVALGRSHALAGAIVVTSNSGAINGDVSSPAGLLARPGPDGVSLPEAIAAANHALEAQDITLAAALAGQTIGLEFPLLITRDGTTVTGPIDAAGQPTVTVNGEKAIQFNGILYVLASDVTIRSLRFVWADLDCLSVEAGTNNNPGDEQPRPPQHVCNVRIENNVFCETGNPSARGCAVRVYTEPQGDSVDATIDDVRVIGNAFLYSEEVQGVCVEANGWNCRTRDVLIYRNSFVGVPVNVQTAAGSGSQTTGTRIFQNVFVGNGHPRMLFISNVVDPPPSTGNLVWRNQVRDTVVEGNTFVGAGVHILGGQMGVEESSIAHTIFTNNVVIGGDIGIVGGKWDAVRNRVDGLLFVNNTLLGEVAVHQNLDAGRENTVEGLSFVNTIFSPTSAFVGVLPEQFRYCLTRNQELVAGGTGNILGDPDFVDEQHGDLHLRPESPAVDAGAASEAPPVDIECRPRTGTPDIGAHEFGAADVALLRLSVAKGIGLAGTVPDGFPCGSAASFPRGTVVRLFGKPGQGWRLLEWGGDADCLDGVVTMSEDRACTAVFDDGPRSAGRARRRLGSVESHGSP